MNFETKPHGYRRFRIAEIAMPDSKGLEEGYKNVLHIGVAYLDRGMGGQGRGFYLVMTGCSTDGCIERHALMCDPSEYLLITPAKRYNAKALRDLAASAPAFEVDLIAPRVEKARAYYVNKDPAKPEIQWGDQL